MQFSNGRPLQAREQAITCLEHYIGTIKGTQEHPVVGEFRKLGVDPERVEMLRVRHDSFGVRWVIVPNNEISTRAKAFAEQIVRDNGPFVDKLTTKLTLASIVLHDSAPEFAAGPLLLAADSHSDKEFSFYLDAAAFALEHGLRTIYDLSEEPDSAELQGDLDFYVCETGRTTGENPTLH
jgi:hypothetical protein